MFRRMLRSIKPIFRFYHSLVMVYKRKRYGLKYVHKTFYMGGKSAISPDLIAHEYVTMGPDCWIGPGVELGPYVMIAPRVAFVGGDHKYDVPGTPAIFSGRPEVKKTIIEADVWIGYGAMIMAGTRVGRGAIIGAGSVVLKKRILPYEVYWGVPARKIYERFPDPKDRERHDKMLAQRPTEGEWASPVGV